MFAIIALTSIGISGWLLLKGYAFAVVWSSVVEELRERDEIVGDPHVALSVVMIRNFNHIVLLNCIAALAARHGGYL